MNRNRRLAKGPEEYQLYLAAKEMKKKKLKKEQRKVKIDFDYDFDFHVQGFYFS